MNLHKILPLVLAGLSATNCLGQSECKKGKSPFDELPAYIRQVTHFGQRADFSHDAKKILFMEKMCGDVYEVDLETKIIRSITHNYYHEGYTRALYLANGDILLSGARKFDAENPIASRREENAELWVQKKDLSGPPMPLGEHCSEGPAVSRRQMRIAWTYKQAFYMADIVYEDGKAKPANKKKILGAQDLPFECWLETQNFRPPDEKEIIFSAYGYQGSEVMGVDIETAKVTNYSNAPERYEEPEGIFPDGKHTLIECNAHNPSKVPYGGDFPGFALDIYKLALDGSGKIKRLTYFNDYPDYKATNPVVSDDGRFMAFQYAKVDDIAGAGRGILIFDLTLYENMKSSQSK
ncbi:MAG: TolB-like translocation protein [Planctomycetota bacterium]|jgi:hypothetical protein